VQKDIASQVGVQALGVLAAATWCGLLTWVILKAIAMVSRLRVSEDKETEGLDLAEHGERGYSQ
jgi:Amt family ammonium transporter